MKKLLLTLAVMIAFAACASAQVPSKPFNVYAGGGLTFPTGPEGFNDLHKLGYNLGGGIGFNAMPMIQLIGKVEFHSISKDWDFFPEYSDVISGGKFQIWMYGIDARLAPKLPAVPIKPFALAGIGFARLSQTDIVTPLETAELETLGIFAYEPETKFYFNIGGGVDFQPFPMLTMFLQARYVSIKQDDENLVMIPVTLGVKF